MSCPRTERYNELLSVYRESKNWEEEDKDFSSYNYKVREGLTSLRRYFINGIINQFHDKYAPNLHLETYLSEVHKFRNGRSGEVVKEFFLNMFEDLDFDSETVENWFKELSDDTEKLNTITLENLIHLAKRMGSYPSEPFKMLSKRRLRLRAGTWHGRYVSIYHLSEKIHALECLIELYADPNQDLEPRNIITDIGIKSHMDSMRLRPEEFYSSQEVDHPIVEKFKFHKNGKLVIVFKTEQQAQNVFNLIEEGINAFFSSFVLLYISRNLYPSSSTENTNQETFSEILQIQANN